LQLGFLSVLPLGFDIRTDRTFGFWFWTAVDDGFGNRNIIFSRDFQVGMVCFNDCNRMAKRFNQLSIVSNRCFIDFIEIGVGFFEQ